MKTWKRVRILLVLVILFAATGTAGFHYLENWSWFDSLYMVVITFSTVGYGEVHQLSHLGRIFNVGVIIAGVRVATVISVGLATIAAAIGAGGLGEYIFRGLAMVNDQVILAGAIPAALMALLADYGLGQLEKRLTPRS